MTHPLPVASKLPINSWIAKQLPTHVRTHTPTCTHVCTYTPTCAHACTHSEASTHRMHINNVHAHTGMRKCTRMHTHAHNIIWFKIVVVQLLIVDLCSSPAHILMTHPLPRAGILSIKLVWLLSNCHETQSHTHTCTHTHMHTRTHTRTRTAAHKHTHPPILTNVINLRPSFP